MKAVVIGTGLIGGSFALALRQVSPGTVVTGVDTNEEHLQEALDLGVIDEAGSVNAVADADLVVLAVPVHVASELLVTVLNRISDKALVMDMGSTKEHLCLSVAEHRRRGNFLAAHPIAGTEYSGPSAAFSELYHDKKMVLCETEKTRPDLLEKALELFKDLGLQVRNMDPESHDKHLAYVSHLSHISSFMLGKTVLDKEKDERNILDLAGSGFASTVRLAKSSPDMWTPIFQQNREPVLEALDAYIENLMAFRTNLQNKEYQALHREMRQANVLTPLLGQDLITQ